MAELCSELPDMQLELDAPVIENVWKVIVHTKEIALRMETMEIEYKARIEELEKRDPTMQLKVVAKEVKKQIAYRITDMTHLLETTTESWIGIEQIETTEEVREEIRQTEAEIAKLKEETLDITPVQRMVQKGKRRKLQIQLQRLREDEIEFMKVTQPWQDELTDLVHKLEMKLMEFKET